MVNRFVPLKMKNSNVLRNRVVVPPMASSTAGIDGYATDSTIAHYERLSQSRAGLVIVEYTYVHPSGRSEENQLGIAEDGQIAGLKRIARVIKESGALAGIQLTHSGGKSSRVLTGGQLMGPSALAVPVKGESLEIPNAMDEIDIELWRRAFGRAVERAVGAGFDLVEFHSAHGYGLNQWLSPLTNRRDDKYGGSPEYRFRLLEEIVGSARASFPELLLSVRMPGQEFLSGGLEIADTIGIAGKLEKLGVDLVHVSSGIGGWRRPSERVGQGYLVPEAELIQAQVSVPVIGVGGIETGSFIDQGLAGRRFSLAAVGRAILKDPKAWSDRELVSA
jgi:NADPH2 dehydrogenase